MRRVLLVLAVITMAGCVTMPQTQDEFRTAVSGGAMFMTTKTYIARQNYDHVSTVLNARAEDCLNYRTTFTRQQGFAASTMTDDYHARFNELGPSRAELIIQNTPRSRRVGPDMPEGGFYWMVIDIEGQADGTTMLRYYGTSGETKAYNAIKAWSDGEAAACPFS
jgi:hypothetical protein